MNWPARKPGQIPLLCAVLLMIATAIYLPGRWRAYHHAALQVERSREILSTSQDFLSELKDAETGQRGYLLTKKTSYLAPYNSALVSLAPLLQRLRDLGGLDPEFTKEIDQIANLTREKLTIIDSTIHTAQNYGVSTAMAIVEGGRGKATMDEIRRLDAILELNQAAQLQAWDHRSEALGDQTLIFGGLSVFLLAGLLLIGTLSSQRAYQREIELVAQEREGRYALEKSEVRFRSVAESAPVLIWMTDTTKKHTYFNKPWLDFTGRTLEQEVGAGWAEGIHLEDRAARLDVFTKAFEARQPFHLEYRLRRSDGDYRWVADQSVPMYLDNKEFTGYIGSVLDIHEHKTMEAEMEKRVKERTEQLHYKEEELMQSRKIEAIGRLAGGVAHDFNNLLTGVFGIAEEVRDGLPEGHPRESMEEILKAVQRASALTKQLLAFGRRQIVTPVILNLDKSLPEMTGMLKRLIGEDIQLVTLLRSGAGNIRMDPGQLEQIIINLVLNGRDAMPQGGKITIETAAIDLDENYAKKHFYVVPGPYVMLAISDTGVGMDEQTQEHIFEPFFTTKRVGQGSGMGLATVYGIVKQNNGDIFLYSTPGAGTTIKIYLPRTTAAADVLPAPRKEIARGDETILLVEDEDLVRRVASRALHRRGYKVLEARNGKEALEIAASYHETIHLLFTDVIMPGLNGRQLAELLASQRPEMKILYTSGYTENIIVQRGMLKPGISFIEKSFTADTVCAKVRDVLDAPNPVA